MNIEAHVAEVLDVYGSASAQPAWLFCDRHPRNSVALTVVEPNMRVTNVTFEELGDLSRTAAAGLRQLGIGRDDRVATLMGKSADLVATMLGIWRVGAVYVPLFTAFASEAIAMRLEDSRTKVVITDAVQRPKLGDALEERLDACRVVLGRGSSDTGRDLTLAALAKEGIDVDDAPESGGNRPLVHMFTSGTTGKPKGVVHPLRYVAGWQIYLEHALGVRGDDVFWCAADPGWAYGLYAGVIAPLAMGQRTLLYTGPFDAAKTWGVLAALEVTNFAAAPTVYRSLRLSAPQHPALPLERASSAGEPLTAEVNEWAVPILGIEVHDHFGQTEVGMVLANHHDSRIGRSPKPSSMGCAVPGWSMTVLRHDRDEPAAPDVLGRLAINVPASPLMTFRGYDGNEGDGGRFVGNGRWYVTGDAARADLDGDFFFQARDDDVIIMAGYRIGPFEIESVIAQHEAVAECAVIGAPDAARGEVLEAYVVLRPAFEASSALAGELQSWVKARYAAHAYPRVVHFIPELPKTPSGKIQRLYLRQQRTAELTRTAGI